LFACPVDIHFVKEIGTILSPNPVCLIRQASWIAFILTAFLVPAFLAAQTPPVTKVLIYYNSNSPIASAEPVTVVTNILTLAGAQVTSIDVASTSYCPTGDNWGDYNQVWDLRCLDYSSSTCPQVYPDLDTFMACWQTKSISYLQSGGNLYLAGEYNGFNRKNTGISDLLITIGAVKSGYTDCPGVNGNGLDLWTVFLACNFPGQSGPTTYSGVAMGGIPIPYLNGSNIVSDPTLADWGDGVDRSIVSGWLGGAGQMVNLTGNVGNLVTTWDFWFVDRRANREYGFCSRRLLLFGWGCLRHQCSYIDSHLFTHPHFFIHSHTHDDLDGYIQLDPDSNSDFYVDLYSDLDRLVHTDPPLFIHSHTHFNPDFDRDAFFSSMAESL
jgi:hypothetical protein